MSKCLVCGEIIPEGHVAMHSLNGTSTHMQCSGKKQIYWILTILDQPVVATLEFHLETLKDMLPELEKEEIQEITIKPVFMTQEEYENSPEFGGY